MAEVWLAEDTRLRRWVAVKVLHAQFTAADTDLVAAFEREATVVARLQHPNIVGVYDAGAWEGRQYFVMEYVHGFSLRQLLESKGRLPEAEAIRYGAQVASALEYAHHQDVIHCDVKPENVLITEGGAAKVADFGVAETLTRTMAPGQAKDLLGTVAYLAPEVIQGSNPSPASDIYSLALTVFEMVAGRPPFSGVTAGASVGQRLAAPAPLLRTFATGASPELERVLARALALSPADRYPSAAAFGAALQHVSSVPAAAPTSAPIPVSQPRPVQVPVRRHPTARVRRQPPPPSGGGSGAAILLAVAVVLGALGVGVAAALFISRDGGGGGDDGTPTPTATVTATSPTPQGTPTPGPSPQPTATVTPTQTAPATASPTAGQSATPTRTPTRTPPASSATSAGATATQPPQAQATPTP